MPDTMNLLDVVRYCFSQSYAPDEVVVQMEANPSGPWVRYEDAERIVRQAREVERKAFDEKLADVVRDRDAWCKSALEEGIENARLRAELETAKRLTDAVRNRITYWRTASDDGVCLGFRSPSDATAFESAMRDCDPAPVVADTGERETDKWRLTGVVDVDGKLVDVTFSRDFCARIVAMGGDR